MVDTQSEQATGAKIPWTEAVLSLLADWQRRAAVSQDAHYVRATRLTKFNIWFGVPVVALTTFVGTSVFATLQEDVRTDLRILVGFVSVLAAVLASLQTFLRFQERAEKHRAAAELWSALRREIDEMLALHPDYLAERSDPKAYLDELRRRMDEVSGQSPEIGDRDWSKADRKFGGLDVEPQGAPRRPLDGDG
ncbi:MAG: SLATT domain-containing protein [Actinomycetota bacterium]|nr:SLATT domain-containing protein [Actinomycetota bacterium]